MAADVKVKQGLGIGEYDVFVGGVKIGEVRKKITRYHHLRRPITTTGWFGRLEAGMERVPDAGLYGTRRDAVAALVRTQEVRAAQSFRMAQGLEP